MRGGMIVTACCLNAVAAHAEETVCKGTRYVMEDGISVTEDVDSDTAKTCIALARHQGVCANQRFLLSRYRSLRIYRSCDPQRRKQLFH